MKNLFKYASLLMAAAMLFSCEKPNGDDSETGALTLTSDKNLIQTFGGDFATLTVKLGDDVVTEGVTFFDDKNNILDIKDFKFSTSKAGEHVIWANYGTSNTDPISIKAISVEIPATPADPKPNSTEFKTRALVTEFTTTGCTYCPNMKTLLHTALENPSTADQVVLTACHSGLINNVKDPAYVRTEYDDFCGVSGFPYLCCDMYMGFNNYTTPVNEVIAMFDELCSVKEEGAAGIAVNSSLVDGQLVAKVTLKAAQTATYRIGAFLLEDNVYGQQVSASADWMHNHDGVIRYIDSKYTNKAGKAQFYGHSVGNVAEGKTADYVFVWDLDKIWEEGSNYGELYGGCAWEPFVEENLHLAVFVSTIGSDDKGNEFYFVNNVIDCPINGNTPYEYR